MRYALRPRLVNDRFGDPALLIEVVHAGRFVLFDCGDLHAAPAEALRQVSDVFISHAHLDHLIGFDHLLRHLLDLPRTLRIFGPAGTAGHIAAKLQAYSWNLPAGAQGGPRFIAHDFLPGEGALLGRLEVWRMTAAEKFAPVPLPPRLIDDGRLFADDDLEVRAAVLDHALPCLGFAFATPPRFHAQPDRLAAEGLRPGRWIAQAARLIEGGAVLEIQIELETRAHTTGENREARSLGWLKERIFAEEKPQRFAYVTDAADSPGNRATIIALAKSADRFFVEAGFLDRDAEEADARSHLTAKAAGTLAAAAEAATIEPFHFSERYRGRESELLAEIAQAFGKAIDGVGDG